MKEALKISLCNQMPLSQNEKSELYHLLENYEKENERYRIAINEMAMIICKAIEHIEKSWNDKCTIPLEEVGYSTDNRWEIWKILKGSE